MLKLNFLRLTLLLSSVDCMAAEANSPTETEAAYRAPQTTIRTGKSPLVAEAADLRSSINLPAPTINRTNRPPRVTSAAPVTNTPPSVQNPN